MEKFQLDPLDRRLLRLLQREGDLSQAQLAERVGASPASCWRRVKALESAGVIAASVRLLDPAAVGRTLNVLCQVRMKTHDLQARASFERVVQSHDEIMECYAMSGEWDYLLWIVVEDIGAYEHFLMRELLNHEAVATSSSHFALKRIKYTTALPV